MKQQTSNFFRIGSLVLILLGVGVWAYTTQPQETADTPVSLTESSGSSIHTLKDMGMSNYYRGGTKTSTSVPTDPCLSPCNEDNITCLGGFTKKITFNDPRDRGVKFDCIHSSDSTFNAIGCKHKCNPKKTWDPNKKRCVDKANPLCEQGNTKCRQGPTTTVDGGIGCGGVGNLGNTILCCKDGYEKKSGNITINGTLHNEYCAKKFTGCRKDSDCPSGENCKGYKKSEYKCEGTYEEETTAIKYSCDPKIGVNPVSDTFDSGTSNAGEICSSKSECKRVLQCRQMEGGIPHAQIYASSMKDCLYNEEEGADENREYGYFFDGTRYNALNLCLSKSSNNPRDGLSGNGEPERCPAPCRSDNMGCKGKDHQKYCERKPHTITLPSTSYQCHSNGFIPYKDLICKNKNGYSVSVNWSNWSECASFLRKYNDKYYSLKTSQCLTYGSQVGGNDYTTPPKCPVPEDLCNGLNQSNCKKEPYCDPINSNNMIKKNCESYWGPTECNKHIGCNVFTTPERMGVCKKHETTHTGTWSCENVEGTCSARQPGSINGISFSQIDTYCSSLGKVYCGKPGYCENEGASFGGYSCLDDDNYFCDLDQGYSNWQNLNWGVAVHNACFVSDPKLCSWTSGKKYTAVCSNGDCDPDTKPSCGGYLPSCIPNSKYKNIGAFGHYTNQCEQKNSAKECLNVAGVKDHVLYDCGIFRHDVCVEQHGPGCYTKIKDPSDHLVCKRIDSVCKWIGDGNDFDFRL